MLLRESDFIELEGGAPLLMQNHYYLQKNADSAWKKTRIWAKLLLNRDINNDKSLDDEKKVHSLNNQQNKPNDAKSKNYGLKIMNKPDRIIRKDADRTFMTEPKRQLLITLLESLKTLFNDYQQTMSYVSGILLLFFDPKTVFEMMYTMGRSPKYNMSGYWRAEAIAQGIDAYVFYDIIKEINPKLYQHLSNVGVLPDTFIQKWFGGLAVQVMPIEYLIPFWTGYFQHGFRYLFKFMIAFLQTLSPLLLSINVDYKLYEVLRVERKSHFWQTVIRNENNNLLNNNLTEYDKISMFFKKVLNDIDGVNSLYNVDNIDFHKAREIAFDKYLNKRFLNAAQNVTWKGYEVESEEEEDEFKDCEQCDDGFAEVFCEVCQIYLCEDCQENPSGDHALTHAIRSLEIDDDTVNID